MSLLLLSANGSSLAQSDPEETDTNKLRFPIQPTYDPLLKEDDRLIFGEEPSNVETEVEYDPETGNYEYRQKMGDLDYSTPSYMSFDEYKDYQMDKSLGDYWKQIREEAAESEDEDGGGSSAFRPTINVNSEKFDRIFGGNAIEIRPNLSAELIFGVNSSKTENPQIPVNQQRITTFDFRQNIQLNAIGNIGDKLRLQFNYNTQATFNFENQMKLEYTGYEDEIIQKIELGNVSLPLQSSLISGSQALFGVKTQLKFGRLTVTSVYSQQQSERKEVTTEGGAQEVEFEVGADEYEMNRHYFLSHFFRDQYERALATPPIINSSVNITRVEVWVTNTNFSTEETRNVVALQDLAESQRVFNESFSGVNDLSQLRPAQNGANNVYSQLFRDSRIRGFTQSSQRLEQGYGLKARFDYQKIELARKLTPDREYTIHPQLGYISLTQELQPNQVLAVAFEYTYNGRPYKVGEFSNETNGGEALILKMLKSTELNTRFPMWDLMMKNVYAIGAYQLQPAGFDIGIWYLDRQKGIDINYLPIPATGLDDRPLLQVVGLDRINNNNAIIPDGIFDFLANPRITVNPANGRIYFPYLEPFGEHLRNEIFDKTGDPAIATQYAFDSLYTNTRANAQYNFPALNRFSIKGHYTSSNSSEISLNAFNIPEGSVVVTAGGAQLTENQDYTVDYNLGRVKIINQGILESGIPIKVSLESNSAFGINRKALFASRFDYEISEDFNLGGTIMNLSERPLTQKVNFGDEPINNTVLGIDGTFSSESQFLTTMVDRIPLIDTKEKSNFTIQAEAARLFPGHSRAIGQEGNSFIDDFEGSQSVIDLRAFNSWFIASTPQGQPDLFPEAVNPQGVSSLAFNKNRSRLSWYIIDPLFYRNDNTTPDHISGNDAIQENHLMRAVFETEVFPNREFSNQTSANNFQISMFDLAMYPEEPGPYNFDVNPEAGVSRGLTDAGVLAAPETRWAGIMRRIDQNDFDAANIEFIQFWMMDPYAEQQTAGFPGSPGFETDGALYFNIGNVSEDILKDEFKAFENGFPTALNSATNLANDTLSDWGRVPVGQQIVNAFDNNPDTRPFQDVGLDGFRDEEEFLFYDSAYVQPLQARANMDNNARQVLLDDPSHDNYNFYRDDDYDSQQRDILERYKFYNGLEGNSPTSDEYPSQNADGYPTSATTIPDAEDINRDNTLDNVESYYQYKVDITEQSLANEGRNYINDILETEDANGNTVRWIQFKIPIREYERAVGGIQDFRSIRFMRMYMRGFENPVVLRFARLELVRGEWRRFTGDLDQEGEVIADDPNVAFNIGAVNIEENASKEPVNYVLPPQLQREIQAGAPNLARQNEQSLALQACGLEDGKAQAAFRNVTLDMRSFKKLQMFLHAEQMDPISPLDNNDVKVFIRIGTDFTSNYYEYETPISVTDPGFYQNDVASDQEQVWPLENNVIINFEDLFRAKRERNEQLNVGDPSIALNQRFEIPAEAGRKIFVVGNPNLADVRVVMIGVRNPAKRGNPADDGLPKCVEVWANELRLTDFDQSGGEAAMARISANLADFASVTLSGSVSTPGWGSLESRVSERQRETISSFDASAQVQLDKFVPEEVGLKVPMFVGYSNTVSNPQFAPEQPDTPMDVYLEDREPEERDSLKKISQTYTERKSINFTNVRKEKTSEGDAHFYDISNLSATYAYTETNFRDFNTEYNFTKNYRGGLAYSFSNNPKSYEPFKDVKVIRKSKYLRLLRDFNFSLAPKTFSVRNDLDRRYTERKVRNLQPGITVNQPAFVDKSFNWNRVYNLAWDITKSLKIDYNANNRALIREYEGERISRSGKGVGGFEVGPDGEREDGSDSYELHRDSLLSSLRNLGMTTNFNQTTSLTYNVPINKLPFMDWTNLTARYSGTYDWQRGPLPEPDLPDTIGHTISNGQQLQLNATLNMVSLYNKVPFLREVNRGSRGRGARAKPKNERTKSKNTETGTEGEEEKEEKKKELKGLKAAAKIMMSVKNISGSYTQNRGIILPGFRGEPTAAGIDYTNGGSNSTIGAPGLGFVFGQQQNFSDTSDHFADWAGNEMRWLVRNPNLFNPFTQSFTENLNLRASVQPIRDLRIDLTANESFTQNTSEYWTFVDSSDLYGGRPRWSGGETELITGNYSASIWAFATTFNGIDTGNSSLYNDFLSKRRDASLLLGREEGIAATDDDGYTIGYGEGQQDVLIAAFVAAYTGSDVDKGKLNPLKTLPLPNWRVNYSGLGKLKFFKKYFRSFSINHAYRSTYTVGNYQKSSATVDTFALSTQARPEFIIANVIISEQFSPLINLDMTWNNSLLTRFEIKRDRNLSLSTSNQQITEVGNTEYVIGSGYTLKQVPFPFTIIPGKKIKSDLTLRADFSIRRSKTVIRKIIQDEVQATAGQTVYSLKVTGDYVLSQSLTLRLFYDWVSNRPVISNSFPTSNTNAGISLRFTLSG